MRQAPLGHGHSMALNPDESMVNSQHHVQSPSDRVPSRNAAPPGSHSRDVSTARGRAGDAAGFGAFTLQPHPRLRANSHSKSPESTSGRSGISGEGEGLERRPSNSYGHHRQTSIVHGNIQHSRNPSLAAAAASPATSPMSPEMISATGHTAAESKLNGARENPEFSSNYMTAGGSAGNLLQMSPLSTIPDADHSELSDIQHTHKKVPPSGKLRRENSHHPSHSKHSIQEAKTVGEYALHHLFNSVRNNTYTWDYAVSG